MKSRAKQTDAVREYRQVARAEASAARDEKIVGAFRELLSERWPDEITLADVARRADVTVQTVIRKFGGKDGLLLAVIEPIEKEVMSRRMAPGGEIEAAIASLIADYEVIGDPIMRILSMEDRMPEVAPLLERGRRSHRDWVSSVFRAWLKDQAPKARREMLDQLVAATDVYVWRLFRRDMGHDRAAAAALMTQLVYAILKTRGAAKASVKTA